MVVYQANNGGIWPNGPITLKSVCGIYVNTPIRGPWIEYVEYDTDKSCTVYVAEDPFDWWIVIIPVAVLILVVPIIIWKCRKRDPVVPETGDAGDLLFLCDLQPGHEGALWKQPAQHPDAPPSPNQAFNEVQGLDSKWKGTTPPDSQTMVERLNTFDDLGDLPLASRPSTKGSAHSEDPLVLVDLEEETAEAELALQAALEDEEMELYMYQDRPFSQASSRSDTSVLSMGSLNIESSKPSESRPAGIGSMSDSDAVSLADSDFTSLASPDDIRRKPQL